MNSKIIFTNNSVSDILTYAKNDNKFGKQNVETPGL